MQHTTTHKPKHYALAPLGLLAGLYLIRSRDAAGRQGAVRVSKQ